MYHQESPDCMKIKKLFRDFVSKNIFYLYYFDFFFFFFLTARFTEDMRFILHLMKFYNTINDHRELNIGLKKRRKQTNGKEEMINDFESLSSC